MPAKKRDSKNTWTDPDDAPELTEEWFQTADLYEGNKHPPRPPKKTAAKRGRQHPARSGCAGLFPQHRPALAIAHQRGFAEGCGPLSLTASGARP